MAGKKYRAAAAKIDRNRRYPLSEAVALLPEGTALVARLQHAVSSATKVPVTAAIEYRVRAPDGAETRRYRIVPVDPLFVSDLVVSAEYPPHTGLPTHFDSEMRFNDPPHMRGTVVTLAQMNDHLGLVHHVHQAHVLFADHLDSQLPLRVAAPFDIAPQRPAREPQRAPRGGIVVRLRHAAGDRVLIEVEDHCGGLPPGAAEQMFQPFVQNDADRSGLGLGLSICRNSVEANEGALRVRDLPGSGCVFVIDLPRHAAPERLRIP